MKIFHKYAILIVGLFFSQAAKPAHIDENYKAICAGIEVIGVDSKTAQKVRDRMPLQKGDTYIVSEADKYRPICIKIVKEIIPQAEPSCSFLIYGDATVYIIVDVSSTRGKKIVFRTIPEKNGKVSKLPSKLIKLYDKWEDRRSFLISRGTFPIESFDKGYIDYDDPVLHKLAVKLSKLVRKHNDSLLDIMHYSKDADERSRAAVLFSWSKHSENIALILKWGILLDPDRGVRNDIARAFTFFLGQIQDKTVQKDLLSTYCKLTTLPGHTDRNKALNSIKRILDANPDLVSSIDDDCKKTITNIGEASILDNVGGVAKDIMKIVNSSENG